MAGSYLIVVGVLDGHCVEVLAPHELHADAERVALGVSAGLERLLDLVVHPAGTGRAQRPAPCLQASGPPVGRRVGRAWTGEWAAGGQASGPRVGRRVGRR